MRDWASVRRAGPSVGQEGVEAQHQLGLLHLVAEDQVDEHGHRLADLGGAGHGQRGGLAGAGPRPAGA